MIQDTVTGRDVKRNSLIRSSLLVVLAAAAAITMTGCQHGGTAKASAPPTAASAVVADQPSGSSGAAPASGPSVGLSSGGYLYQVALDSPGLSTVTSMTTDDGTGTGGAAIDATPGHTLLTATLAVTNKTDRPEPLPFVGVGPLPASVAPFLSVVVPRARAAAFGLAVTDQQAMLGGTVAEGVCGDATTNAQRINPAPIGYCNLNAELAGYSPAKTDLTQPPQLAPGETGSLTIVVQNTLLGTPVPDTAPLSHAQVAIETTSTDTTTWVELS